MSIFCEDWELMDAPSSTSGVEMSLQGKMMAGRVAIPPEVCRRLRDGSLKTLARKLSAGERLEARDGLACLATNDLAGLGCLASAVRSAMWGQQAFYVVNLHLNYTNICINRCAFCAFRREKDAGDAYTMTPEDAARHVDGNPLEGLSEVHIVGGCHPDLPFDYYTALLRSVRSTRPGIGIKAFSAVEIHHMAQRSRISVGCCLEELKKAGLTAMPGGGAEIFSRRLHRELFPDKIDAGRWLEIHQEAHRIGIHSNATMLFGHRETLEERVGHLIRLRAQQDRSGGFRSFIPLPFHPENTRLSHLAGPTGVDVLKTMAAARLLLDNIPHIKAYWVMLGVKLTQVALSYGADDLEGTIGMERIAHEAGARTAKGLTVEQIEGLVKEAGFLPARRDTHHRILTDGRQSLQ